MSNGKSGGIEIQDRDVALLRTLFECRVMTRSQAAILHFDGKLEATKKRVQALKAAGYINDRPRLPHEPAVLMLTKKGFELLHANGALHGFRAAKNWKQIVKRLSVSALTLQHELEVMDFRAAIIAAVRQQPHLSIAEFCTWPAMLAFESFGDDGQRVEIRPDGFFRLIEQAENGEKHEHSFYVEVDRSTEGQTVLVERIRHYRNYGRGVLTMRFDRKTKDHKPFPFRVLVICRSVERRSELGKRLRASDTRIGAMAWITTIDEATSNTLGAIWVTPVDYSKAIVGTPPGISIPAGRSVPDFKNQGNGEMLVEERLTKRRLLQSERSH